MPITLGRKKKDKYVKERVIDPTISVNSGSEHPDSDSVSEKLLQAIDDSSEKSLQTRVNALKVINNLMMHKYIPDTIESHKVTLVHMIEKAIKKGKGAEKSWAASIVPLLLIQQDRSEEVYKLIEELKPVLLMIMQDTDALLEARINCCAALGLLNFLGLNYSVNLLSLMQTFEGIFAGSYLKEDNKPSRVNADVAALHVSALNSWGLLFTLIPSQLVYSFVYSDNEMIPSFRKLAGMLQSPHLNVRVAGGETIALILECLRSCNVDDDDDEDDNDDEDDEYNEDDEDNENDKKVKPFVDFHFLKEEVVYLMEAFHELANDSNLYRAKRDRIEQRSKFRDICRYITENVLPDNSIKVCKQVIELNTWSRLKWYSCIQKALGTGMNTHLNNNLFLRDVFLLGRKQEQKTEFARKQEKLLQKAFSVAASKERTVAMLKKRNKKRTPMNFDVENWW